MAPSADRAVTYPALDTLRFVGAVAVLLTHVCFQTGQYGPGVLGTLVARLDSGVALFFVLSGFLLSRPFVSRMERRAPLPRPGFYAWKRVLRIVPVYVVTVVLVLSLLPPSRGPFWPHWVENLTMTVIYTPGSLPQGLTQMWSLATEVAFYAVLPLVMLVVARTACRSRWRPGAVLVVLAVLCAANLAWLALVPLDGDKALWLPAYLTWFSAGIALAVASVDAGTDRPARWTRAVARLGTTPVACIVGGAAVLLIASTPVAGPIVGDVPTAAEAITKNLLYVTLAVLLVAPGVFGGPASRFLAAASWAPLRYLGRISYGIFCTHLMVLYGVFAWRDVDYFDGHFVEVLVLTLAGSIALSALLYRFVETPADRLRGTGRPKTEPATTPHATAVTT